MKNELLWSPPVSSQHIDVLVLDGVATLEGRASSWQARAAATEQAFEGGAVVVKNNLRVN